MIRLGKNRFVCIFLLLGLTLPVTGQIYTTSKAKVHSVSTTGVGYDNWDNTTVRGNAYGSSSSFYSTSSHISAGPVYSVSAPALNVKTSFSTSAAAITGGVTLADDFGLDVGGLSGPNKSPGGIAPPTEAPIGDIPWIVLVLAAFVFVLAKRKRIERRKRLTEPLR